MLQISVIMPVYNESILELKESIRSIRYQTFKNFEFIIVDDNPQSDIIKQFLLLEKKKDNRIKLIFNKYNIGSMASANKAISVSRGEYIARMDADDVSALTRLQYQLDFCLKYKLDFSCCNLRSFYKSKNGNLIYDKRNFNPNITQVNPYKIKRTISHINIAIGPALFFKRRIAESIGCYRYVVCEDYDLAMRFLINNYKIGYLSKALVYKRDRVNNISTLDFLQEFVSWYSISKYTRKFDFDKVIPLIVLQKKINSINIKNIVRYNKFKKNSKKYKKDKSLITLLKKYFYALSSPFMFKWSFYTRFTYIIQYFLLK